MSTFRRRVALAAICSAAALYQGAAMLRAQIWYCPCSIWTPDVMPANAAIGDQPIEVGVKFRSDVAGFITAIRFYKGTANTGAHVGHLWSASGAMLAEATFANETVEGWQEVQISPAVAVAPNTTYVASYHSSGRYASNIGFFAAGGVDTPPLHVPPSAVNAPNGVYTYSAAGGFPTSGTSNNYWVDVVFTTDLGPDTTPPTIISLSPADGATNVALASSVKAKFNEPIDPASANAATVEIRDSGNAVLAATVTYNAATRTATASTTSGFLPQSTYTVSVKGGPAGVRDLAGNALASDAIWSFTTGAPAPPADEGPGGPILVVASTSNPFGRDYAEVLPAEGLNEFTVTDISLVTPARLAAAGVVVLGEMPLTAGDVATFSGFVANGGSLIAMRPDAQLAPLLGLTASTAKLSNAYLQVDTTATPGAGIV